MIYAVYAAADGVLTSVGTEAPSATDTFVIV